jgi:hypothetical protein
MNSLQTKVRDAMILLRAAAQEVEKVAVLDPVFAELATALACSGRALKMLKERES